AVDISDRKRFHTPRVNPEGGWRWGLYTDEPSFGSDLWQRDTKHAYRQFLRYYENSPLKSRIIGYQIGSGIYGEWHYFMAEFLPDLNPGVAEKIGHVPDVEERIHTHFGLLRDPTQEQDVISFYRKFHSEIIADTILSFARITKKETTARCLCGTFYGYQLENVWMQEGGHLSPEKILSCPDIDFIAAPYTYQSTNIPNLPDWQHDVQDDGGNWLGRARGVAGDGGYRVLPESLKRHGKMYFVEIDPSTFLQPDPEKIQDKQPADYEHVIAIIGGEGWDTPEGTERILSRDLGQMLVGGNGGWLFDFGHLLSVRKSWYDDERLVDLVKKFVGLGEKRSQLNLSSVAQIAAVYDAKSLFVTRHWKAEAPFPKGMESTDFFTQWFSDAQARSIHRIGAPVNFLYRFDLRRQDVERCKLFLMVNLFYLTEKEVDDLLALFKNSSAYVVWFYAPGFVSPDKLDSGQMERLTGFRFKVLTDPGPMLTDAAVPNTEIGLRFGTATPQFPRFEIIDGADEIWGTWSDRKSPAMGITRRNGWNSVYVGSAPLPIPLLKLLAKKAGIRLWSDETDIVYASEDMAMVVASETRRGTVHLHKPMLYVQSGIRAQIHSINMKRGDVYLFVKE
ncbi:MAG: hypothetical protein GWP06_09870, partial [Actinobacteria bacterium]|nr:hypothetical protein [Actinomycetota bacterium]